MADPVASFQARAVQGLLNGTDLLGWLQEHSVSCDPVEVQGLVSSVCGPGCSTLSQDQALAVLGLLQDAQPHGSHSAASIASISTVGPSRTPFKKLSRHRSYLETGQLACDEAVLSYISKLDEHRRKCEAEGRYQEAQAAALRLADLKTAQVAKLRAQLMTNQTRELQQVHSVFEEETTKFKSAWDTRVAEYEANFRKAVDEIRTAHQQQLQQLAEELTLKRPVKPKSSKEYLQQRKIESSLVKSKQYLEAERVKGSADELYNAELEQTQAAFDAEQRLKVTKFQSRQQQEFEALLQRAARGRDELELRRTSETERRMYRFRNVVTELESLHNLEMVQLENFLDAHVQAGKAVPLKDESAFRRRREALYGTTF